MDWDIYSRIKLLISRRDFSGALVLIQETRHQTKAISADIHVLEGHSLANLGRSKEAIEILEAATTDSGVNFWVYRCLSELYRNTGQYEQCLVATRAAHAKLGWDESKSKSYRISYDFFSPNIPVWIDWFRKYITIQPISALEIGSWQGGSALWLLDKIISKRGGHLTCIDTFKGSAEHQSWIESLPESIEDLFDGNILRSGHTAFCSKLIGNSASILPTLAGQKFDLIYIDGAHDPASVSTDATLSFDLLDEGAYIIFDDYEAIEFNGPAASIASAIDAFVEEKGSALNVLAKGRQLLLQRTAENLRQTSAPISQPASIAPQLPSFTQTKHIDIITVADGARISLSAALNMLIAKKTCPNARFHVAVPKGSNIQSAAAAAVLKEHSASIFSIPTPSMRIDEQVYRIENKVNSVLHSGVGKGVFLDSDTIILRPLPDEYLFSNVPRAAPEHGLHIFPWQRLFETVGLITPSIQVVCAGGEVGLPWLNAGFIAFPNAEAFGSVWRMMCEYVVRCEWVPERFPYLDQIALPLAIAQLSETKSVTFENVLMDKLNQNIFYWAGDQSYVTAGYVVHHHSRVALLRKYLPRIFDWIRTDYPILDTILNEMEQFDRVD